MRIGLITSKPSNERSQLSGAPYYMEKALEKHCGQVFFIRPSKLSTVIKFIGKILNKVSKMFTGKTYASEHTILEAYWAGRHFSKKANGLKLDVIFATRAATQIAFIRSNIPIIYTSDATFKLMEDFYGYWTNLNEISIAEGNSIEKKAISNSARIFYPSSWPINSAIQTYKADPNKLSVIKSGANFDDNDIPSIDQIVAKRDLSRCCLLFIGINWERKGGRIAVETLHHLLAANIPAELTIICCNPPKEILHKKITIIKKLDKSIPEEKNQLIALYKQSNFFLLPTRAETAGLVFCEAAAFGLPVMTTDTGGVASIVKQGINGYALSHNDGSVAYAKLIEQIFRDKDRYQNLVRTSRREYEETLNWDTWGRQVKQLISTIVK